jgi:ribosomal protein S12 methylthiotransferase accessory factor
MLRTLLTAEEIIACVQPFASKRTGMIQPSFELPLVTGNPEIAVFTSPLCNTAQLSELYKLESNDGLALAGASASIHRQQAHAKAYCEALERYCNVVFDPASVIVATRNELGDDAVDLELFPRCSDDEYRQPYNFLQPPSNTAKMRWVQGYSLISGQPRWVPLSAVYISSAFHYPGEAFTLPISTGSALAAGFEQATVSGICEVIERDALMMTWLHQLPLPQIDVSACANPEFWERMERVQAAGIQQYFFDATTDLGVCTVYALQIAPQGRLTALVMAATKLDPNEAISKVLDEASASRVAIEQLVMQPPRFNPEDPRTFTSLSDGAVFYGDRANLPAFDFLLEHDRRRDLAELPMLATGNVEEELDRLIDLFRAQDLELLVVDITVPQVREVGLYAVKVIAPQLMPLITNHNMRFTATPRLYQAPGRMGYPARAAHALNNWPQPFA